jgi:glycosyltransferase involved in cell wall biosynthesis
MPNHDASLSVLHLWAGNLYGGVETFLATLARRRDLCSSLQPHFGLCFEGRLYEEFRACEATVHLLGPVRLSRPWTVWSARRRLRRLLTEHAIDVVCCHGCWPHAVFAPTVRGAGRPLVFWVHDFLSGRTLLERWAARTSPDLVLANSHATRDSVPRVFPDVEAEVLYLPVAAPDHLDRSAVRRQVRRDLGVAEDAVVVVQASRLERWKGHAVLIEALGRLRSESNWVCWIVGGVQRPHELTYQEELKVLARSQGVIDRVRFLGRRDDVPRLLSAADVHCQPNTGPEPFGVAYIEALYAGLPVVASALGGALEIVEKSCGVLTPAGQVEPLANALGCIIADADRRTALGAAGPKRAAALCDPNRQLARLHQLLGAVARREVVA